MLIFSEVETPRAPNYKLFYKILYIIKHDLRKYLTLMMCSAPLASYAQPQIISWHS